MKIAHVFPSQSWGGAEIYTLELAKEQANRGIDVVIWAAFGSPLFHKAQEENINVISTPIPKRMGLHYLPKIIHTIKSEKITHLHLHWSGGAWAFLGIKYFSSVQTVYHIHMWIKASKKDLLHRWVYSQLDSVIVAGLRAQEMVLQKLPFDKNKIRIIPYGFDFSECQRLDPFPFPEDKLTLGVFCRLDFQKGIKEFLLAVEPILKSHPQIHLFLVGEPTLNEEASQRYAKEIQVLLSRPQFNGRYKQWGFTKDYLKLLNQCQILVQPSYHESYALIFLSAFALGIPAISTNSGGTPDLVQEGKTGWLSEPKDIEGLRKTILQAIKDKNEILRKGRLAQQYVFQTHGFDTVIDSLNKTVYHKKTFAKSEGVKK